MNLDKFNDWYNQNFNHYLSILPKKYPRASKTIREDMSDFYLYMVNKPTLDKVKNFEGMLFQYIYNTHYRFFKKHPYKFIELNDSQMDLPDQELSEEELQYNEYHDKLPSILKGLSLDEKNLYKMYFVQNLSTRDIGTKLAISHCTIAKRLKVMKQKIKYHLT